MKTTTQKQILLSKIVALRRNPQYLTPEQMDALKASIERDGFVAPVLVRPLRGGRYEVVSGNHRVMAAREVGYKSVPCVVSKMSADQAKRLAVNLNTIHGDPVAELLAPFLADMSDEVLADIHIDESLLDELINFDAHLKTRLDDLQPPDVIDRPSPTRAAVPVTCCCPNCGARHAKPQK